MDRPLGSEVQTGFPIVEQQRGEPLLEMLTEAAGQGESLTPDQGKAKAGLVQSEVARASSS